MKANERKETVSFKIKKADRKEVVTVVRELLTKKGYKLYEKETSSKKA